MNDARRPPAFLLVALLLAVLSLGVGVVNAFGQQRLADQRNDDRVSSDVDGCRRGNELRGQIIDGFSAIDLMVSGILDLAIRSDDPAQQEAVGALRRQFERPLEDYRRAVAGIELVNCADAVPGAANPTEGDPP